MGQDYFQKSNNSLNQTESSKFKNLIILHLGFQTIFLIIQLYEYQSVTKDLVFTSWYSTNFN